MKRSLLGMGLLLLTATSAQASIVCQSTEDADKPVKVVVDLQTNVGPSLFQQKIAGVTKITSEGRTQTIRSTFTSSQQYLRLGYMRTLNTQLSRDLFLNVTARSYTNEGPATSEFGRLTSGTTVTYLTCK